MIVSSRTLRLRTLVQYVLDGEILLPARPAGFDWSHQQRLLLFDSVYRNVPAGSILCWHTAQHARDLSALSAMHAPQPGRVRTYVIDGYHRLATLVAGLTARGEQTGLAQVIFDLRSDVFITDRKRPLRAVHVPLNCVYDQHGLYRVADRIHREVSDGPEVARLVAQLDKLVEAMRDYEVSVVTLTTESEEDVGEAAARANLTPTGPQRATLRTSPHSILTVG